MALVKVARTEEVEEGTVREVLAKTKRLALVKLRGKFYCLDNACAHMGGPLGEGKLEGTCVVCPWHGWKFDSKTGVSPANPPAKVPTYKVVVKGDEVFVQI